VDTEAGAGARGEGGWKGRQKSGVRINGKLCYEWL